MHWRAEQEGSPHTTEPALSQGGQANCDWREAISRAFFKKKHYIVKTYYFRLTVRKLQVLMLTKEEYSINNRRSTCIYFSIFSPFLYECWNKELSKLWKNHKIFQKINFYLKSCHPPSLPVPQTWTKHGTHRTHSRSRARHMVSTQSERLPGFYCFDIFCLSLDSMRISMWVWMTFWADGLKKQQKFEFHYSACYDNNYCYYYYYYYKKSYKKTDPKI